MVITVIGITGLAGSGKTMLSEYAKKKGYQVYSEGDYIRNEAKKKGLRPTPKNLVDIALEFLPSRNLTIIRSFDKCISATKSNLASITLIEGIKKMSEVNFLRKKYRTYILAILASTEMRYNRLIQRKRTDDPLSFEAFRKRDLRELKYGIGTVMAQADFFIINEGSPTEAKSKFDEILNSIITNIELESSGTLYSL
jgi:dephospho-CoA kinase